MDEPRWQFQRAALKAKLRKDRGVDRQIESYRLERLADDEKTTRGFERCSIRITAGERRGESETPMSQLDMLLVNRLIAARRDVVVTVAEVQAWMAAQGAEGLLVQAASAPDWTRHRNAVEVWHDTLAELDAQLAEPKEKR